MNEVVGRVPYLLWALLGSFVLLFMGLTHGPFLPAAVLASAAIVYWSYREDKTRLVYVLEYALDGPSKERLDAIDRALADAAACTRVWWVLDRQYTTDWRRNAGATVLVKKVRALVVSNGLKRMRTNLPVRTPTGAGHSFSFLPDSLLIQANGRYAATPYEQLHAEARQVSYRETEGVPRARQHLLDRARAGQQRHLARQTVHPDRVRAQGRADRTDRLA